MTWCSRYFNQAGATILGMITADSSQVRFFLRYLFWTGLFNLGWEVVQLPLYTLWEDGSPSFVAFAVLHCTAGDVLIASISLLLARIVSGNRQWPQQRYMQVALTTIGIGVVYTVYSEWSNTVVTRTWAYSLSMPTLWGIGLSPILQWLLIPAWTFWRLSKQRVGYRA